MRSSILLSRTTSYRSRKCSWTDLWSYRHCHRSRTSTAIARYRYRDNVLPHAMIPKSRLDALTDGGVAVCMPLVVAKQNLFGNPVSTFPDHALLDLRLPESFVPHDVAELESTLRGPPPPPSLH